MALCSAAPVVIVFRLPPFLLAAAVFIGAWKGIWWWNGYINVYCQVVDAISDWIVHPAEKKHHPSTWLIHLWWWTLMICRALIQIVQSAEVSRRMFFSTLLVALQSRSIMKERETICLIRRCASLRESRPVPYRIPIPSRMRKKVGGAARSGCSQDSSHS